MNEESSTSPQSANSKCGERRAVFHARTFSGPQGLNNGEIKVSVPSDAHSSVSKRAGVGTWPLEGGKGAVRRGGVEAGRQALADDSTPGRLLRVEADQEGFGGNVGRFKKSAQ